MSNNHFSHRELNRFRELGLDAIMKQLATGFNFYPRSIELFMNEAIAIPVKCGHREDSFITALESAVRSEFGNRVGSAVFPRTVIYQWLKGYTFPKAEERIRIYDVQNRRYIVSEIEYRAASGKLIAEGDEATIVFLPAPETLIDVVQFTLRKGSRYLTTDDGSLVTSEDAGPHPFKINPERLSDYAYITPMIVTSHTPEFQHRLPGFAPVRKLYKLRGQEEISLYIDKTFERFTKNCRLRFKEPVTRLANKLFRDFINFEEEPRLLS